jgi:hypothetical protein
LRVAQAVQTNSTRTARRGRHWLSRVATLGRWQATSVAYGRLSADPPAELAADHEPQAGHTRLKGVAYRPNADEGDVTILYNM